MADFDSAWKETLDTLFEPFMAFFFPDAYREIDWARVHCGAGPSVIPADGENDDVTEAVG